MNTQMHLKKYINNKKNFILGASSDIGIQVVKKFLENDYKVIAHYNTSNKSLKKIKNKNLKIIKFNLKNINSFNNFLSKNNNLTQVSHFLSLTGHLKTSSILNFNTKDFYDHINVNYLSNIIFIRKSIKYMKKNNFGRILFTTSIGTKYGGGLNTYMYSLSKFMNEFFPKFFKTNYKNNILVNTLQIGLTDTKLAFKDKSKNLKKRISLIPINRMAKTKEVTNYIYQLFQEKNSLLTNQILNISGGE